MREMIIPGKVVSVDGVRYCKVRRVWLGFCIGRTYNCYNREGLLKGEAVWFYVVPRAQRGKSHAGIIAMRRTVLR
jgi:hypothetical protein